MLQGLEAASNCVEDLDEWLGMFNVKLRHMREDIESVRASTLQVGAQCAYSQFSLWFYSSACGNPCSFI